MTRLSTAISNRPRVFNKVSDLKNPSDWLLSAFGHLHNDTGVTVTPQTSLQFTAVFRAVTLLAGTIASQPKHLFRIEQGAKRRNKQVAQNHPAHKLIYRKPNNIQTNWHFYFMLVAHALLWGNFYGHIRRNRYYEPVSITPMAPWQMNVHLENNSKVYYYKGKRYTQSDIVHIYGLSLDGITGITPIQYGAQSIGLGMVAERFAASAFGKGVNPGGMVEMSEEYENLLNGTEEEVKQTLEPIRQTFEQTYSGPENFQKLMMLPPGFKFSPFSMDLSSAQLLESRKFQIEDIARLYGVPMHKLMQMENSLKSNLEHLNIEFRQDGVLPLATNIESEFNEKLLPDKDRDTHFMKINLDGIVRADLKTRYEAYGLALGKNSVGFIEPDEVREMEDMSEADENALYKPDNMNKLNTEG